MITTKLKIRTYGDPVLRKRSSPVKSVGPAQRQLIRSMIEAMHESKGIGLAAPQVGISEQILVADIGEGAIALINPKIVRRSGSSMMEEGCLSLPGIVVNVKRPEKIIVQYLDENNQESQKNFSGLMARVVQHEMDHLRGKLICDRTGILEKRKLAPELKKIKLLIT